MKTLLVNGRVWAGERHAHPDLREAIAFEGDRISALGSRAALLQQFPRAVEIDLGGRTVVPGLIDGHCHAIRGAATWSRELQWSDLRDPRIALRVLKERSTADDTGGWLTAVGGWHSSQFAGWMPSRDDLDRAGNGRPVYVQSLYEEGVASTAALAAVSPGVLAALSEEVLPRDDNGHPTGVVRSMPGFDVFLEAAGTPDRADQLNGLRLLNRHLAALGVTGVIDPGGFGMDMSQYSTIFDHQDQLALRYRLFLSATEPGHEPAQVADWIDVIRRTPDHPMLRMVGIGEIVHFGAHDMEGLEARVLAAETAESFGAMSAAVAAAGLAMHMHAVNDETAELVIACWEEVDRHTRLAPLRFSLAHGDRLSPGTIARLAKLGAGLMLDSRQVFRSAASESAWGEGSLSNVPPIAELEAAGVHLGAGTDGTRASVTNPWVTLWWLHEGRAISGQRIRDERHRLGRDRALEAATSGNAWFSQEDGLRGVLRPGALADIAVLDRDYFRVSSDEIPAVRSDLTVVGGRVVHASSDFSGFDIPSSTIERGNKTND